MIFTSTRPVHEKIIVQSFKESIGFQVKCIELLLFRLLHDLFNDHSDN